MGLRTMRYAFFDVDNTIYNGYTASELLFYLEDNGLSESKLKEEYLQAVEDYNLRKIDYNEIAQISLDLVSISLRGKTFKEARDIVREMLGKKGKVFYDWVKVVINYLKKVGYQIILVSAGPDLVIEEVAKIVNADKWYATKLEIKNEQYAGTKTSLLNAAAKSNLMKKLFKGQNIEMSIGFGDSTGDIPMLERVEKAFVVRNNHHQEMMNYAQKKNWTIFGSADEVFDMLERSSN